MSYYKLFVYTECIELHVIGQCKDTNLKDGTYLKDQYGDGCNSYEGEFVHICGDYDGGSGFKAKTMCCVCGGGSTGGNVVELFLLL